MSRSDIHNFQVVLLKGRGIPPFLSLLTSRELDCGKDGALLGHAHTGSTPPRESSKTAWVVDDFTDQCPISAWAFM